MRLPLVGAPVHAWARCDASACYRAARSALQALSKRCTRRAVKLARPGGAARGARLGVACADTHRLGASAARQAATPARLWQWLSAPGALCNMYFLRQHASGLRLARLT